MDPVENVVWREMKKKRQSLERPGKTRLFPLGKRESQKVLAQDSRKEWLDPRSWPKNKQTGRRKTAGREMGVSPQYAHLGQTSIFHNRIKFVRHELPEEVLHLI